jgi:hypothetical protein
VLEGRDGVRDGARGGRIVRRIVRPMACRRGRAALEQNGFDDLCRVPRAAASA